MSGEKGFIPPQLPPLEAAPIGWQLFVLESGKSDSIVFLLLLATYATRLLAQALSERLESPRGRFRFGISRPHYTDKARFRTFRLMYTGWIRTRASIGWASRKESLNTSYSVECL